MAALPKPRIAKIARKANDGAFDLEDVMSSYRWTSNGNRVMIGAYSKLTYMKRALMRLQDAERMLEEEIERYEAVLDGYFERQDL